jgi:hypothetical protein
VRNLHEARHLKVTHGIGSRRSEADGLSYADRVKTTRYFELRMKDRPEIQREWCERVLRDHLQVDEQHDGKYQMWGYIAEAGKYMRIVVLADRETIDNAFFDRSYPRKQKHHEIPV